MAEEVKLLSFDELGLTFGLQLELLPDPADKDRVYPCELVGCVKNECVIVGPPASTGAFPRLVEGQRVALRVKLAGGIALIPSTVLFISEIPAILFFLDFPRGAVFKQVRGALRVNVALPVLGTNVADRRFESVPGKMIDVSTTGARLHMFQELGSVGHKVEIKGKFQVGDIQRIMQISATVRARSVREDGFIYGIEFSSDDEDKLIVLMGFTFHAMAFGTLQTIR